jgi:hypothetical protein
MNTQTFHLLSNFAPTIAQIFQLTPIFFVLKRLTPLAQRLPAGAPAFPAIQLFFNLIFEGKTNILMPAFPT